MADADLHFAGFDLKIRFADRRNGTGGESDADAPAVVDCFLSSRDHLIEGSTEGGFCSAHFPHQYFASDTPAFLPLRFGGGGHIVVRDHSLNLDAIKLGELSRHFYIQVVPGIISIKTGDSFATVGGLERIEKCLSGGRSEDFADRNGVAKIFPDVTDKCRFMSRTAAGHDADLVCNRCTRELKDTRILGFRHQMRIGFSKALEHVFDDKRWVIDDALHKIETGLRNSERRR